MFYMDIPKVDKDIAYVACVSEACCKCFFKMFRLFQTYVASVFYLDVAHVSHICCVDVAGAAGVRACGTGQGRREQGTRAWRGEADRGWTCAFIRDTTQWQARVGGLGQQHARGIRTRSSALDVRALVIPYFYFV